MNFSLRSIFLTIIATVACMGLPTAIQAQVEPVHFKLLNSMPGVRLYASGSTFVHVLRPRDGATVRFLAELDAQDRFVRKTTPDWFADWKKSVGDRAFSAVNAQFFDMRATEVAPLAFAVKINGTVYPGYGDLQEYRLQKRVVFFEDRRIRIIPFGSDRVRLLERSAAKDAMVGLAPEVSKAAEKRLGRTFIGTVRNGNAVLVTSAAATQLEMVQVLRDFGVNDTAMVMLDGGGSTQLVTRGWTLLPRGTSTASELRTIPLALGLSTAFYPKQKGR
jgi:Phosphodiester glycosidase